MNTSRVTFAALDLTPNVGNNPVPIALFFISAYLASTPPGSPPGIEPAPVAAVAPASPASPLDALLARHLGKTRSEVLQARGVPKERSAWLERRRRRANPFAETAE